MIRFILNVPLKSDLSSPIQIDYSKVIAGVKPICLFPGPKIVKWVHYKAASIMGTD